MNRFNRLTMGSVVIACSLLLGSPVTSAVFAQLSAEPVSVRLNNVLAAKSANFFQDLVDFFGDERPNRRRGRIAGTRGPARPYAVCVVNPGKGDVFWSLQPLLVGVQGDRINRPDGMAVRRVGAAAPDWRAPITAGEAGEFQAMYVGEGVKPGDRYEWLFYESFADGRLHGTAEGFPTEAVTFEIMAEGPERDRISAGIAELQAGLSARGASEEGRAIANANYFFDNDLSADAMQVLFSVEMPSAALIDAREALTKEICEQNIQAGEALSLTGQTDELE